MLVLFDNTTYEFVHSLFYSLLEPFRIGEWLFSMWMATVLENAGAIN